MGALRKRLQRACDSPGAAAGGESEAGESDTVLEGHSLHRGHSAESRKVALLQPLEREERYVRRVT